jgi:hypothetical protein
VARIVVSGYAIRYPVAGLMLSSLQFVIGLERLGHEVWFVEEAGWDGSCFDPRRGVMGDDPTYGISQLAALLDEAGANATRWAYRDLTGCVHGPSHASLEELFGEADLYLDLSGASSFEQAALARRRAFVDTDPGFMQIGAVGPHVRLDDYDVLFSYGVNIGRTGCTVPALGRRWVPLLPPTVLDLWEDAWSAPAGDAPWTTVAHWTAYGAHEHEGQLYGQKDVEFLALDDLPARALRPLELALAGEEVPLATLRRRGWRLRDARTVSHPLAMYRAYLRASYGEFSVAKHGYATTRSGWFSDRTACYLAAGRPAVVQDTGTAFASGAAGLLTFTTAAEAEDALAAVEADPDRHRAAAATLARQHLDARRVLGALLETCEVQP